MTLVALRRTGLALIVLVSLFLARPGSPLGSNGLFAVLIGMMLWAASWRRLPPLRALVPLNQGD